jgi:hypothetical protein
MTQPIFIPRHMWHRTIKGTGKLKIKIYKSWNKTLTKLRKCSV